VTIVKTQHEYKLIGKARRSNHSISDDTLECAGRGTKAKSIMSCDNAFMTNILSLRFRAENICCPDALSRNGIRPYVM